MPNLIVPDARYRAWVLRNRRPEPGMGNMKRMDCRAGKMRRGLVLGGGGFFGAFQAGAYEALGEFDCVVGTSAGALNGWAIASGMPPAELQALWREAAGSVRTGMHFPRYWGDGILDTGNLETMVRTLVSDWRPRIDFGVVVSQGWGCRPVLITGNDVDADTILASCAVPFLLPAKRVKGRLSIDGGLRDVCPLWAARAMGAEEIVGVNVWTHLPAWWPGHGRNGYRNQPDVTMIEPQRALGPLRDGALGTPRQVAAWIDAGRHTANAVFARQYN
ncbi:MAG: patatin-like phospholipase family protein [Bryobacteraceae bacterium]